MTVQELEIKLNDSNIRVEKRKSTISKLCKKLEISFDLLMDDYNSKVNNYELDYLQIKTCKEIVYQYIQEKPERDILGKWIEENNDFNSKIDQLIENLNKLYDVEKVANNWNIKYQKAKQFESSEKIESIWNFLLQWKEKVIVFVNQELERYNELIVNQKEAYKEYLQSNNWTHGYYFEKLFLREYYQGISGITKQVRLYNGKLDEEKLIKILDKDVEIKYTEFVKRIEEKAGEIQDTKYLTIGEKGEINGFVLGSKNKVRVETIGAGGYNIQIFHYRTLVNVIK